MNWPNTNFILLVFNLKLYISLLIGQTCWISDYSGIPIFKNTYFLHTNP